MKLNEAMNTVIDIVGIESIINVDDATDPSDIRDGWRSKIVVAQKLMQWCGKQLRNSDPDKAFEEAIHTILNETEREAKLSWFNKKNGTKENTLPKSCSRVKNVEVWTGLGPSLTISTTECEFRIKIAADGLFWTELAGWLGWSERDGWCAQAGRTKLAELAG